MVHDVRKSIPGSNANLPAFIVERMEELEMRPTYTQLAFALGMPISTLRENIRGTLPMKLSTAIRLAELLKCDLSELVKNAGLQ